MSGSAPIVRPISTCTMKYYGSTSTSGIGGRSVTSVMSPGSGSGPLIVPRIVLSKRQSAPSGSWATGIAFGGDVAERTAGGRSSQDTTRHAALLGGPDLVEVVDGMVVVVVATDVDVEVIAGFAAPGTGGVHAESAMTPTPTSSAILVITWCGGRGLSSVDRTAGGTLCNLATSVIADLPCSQADLPS